MSAGCVYLVGAGAGDPGLLTLRGRDLLARADVVVYDYFVSPRLLQHAPARAERIYVGKRAGARTFSQEEINRLLVERARSGAVVVRLKGGDPFVFGRGGEEALALSDAGIRFEVVPGVTAGIAVPAYAGIPVTHRQFASGVGLLTGHETPDKEESSLDWGALGRWKGTLSFYMGTGNLRAICERLAANGLNPQTPAAAIRWGATPSQRVVTATVRTLAAAAEAAGFEPPAMIVIGQVVALRHRLNWFERRPLFGRRVVVTRARAQASGFAALLEEQGAEVIELPTFRIEPPTDPAPLRESAAQAGERFDWIVFTSVNAAAAFFDALRQAGLDARALGRCRVAAIGPATAERLAQCGIRADVQPAAFTAAAVVEALAAAHDLKGRRVLRPQSDIAPPDLSDRLRKRGAVVTEVVAYRNVSDDSNAANVRELLLRGEIHWLTFTSPSTVRRFCSAVGPQALSSGGPRIASIGPATSAALAELGLTPAVEAKQHTIPGLLDAIVQSERTAMVPNSAKDAL
jgi:uroporphyrinogen III methyltransferase/synthase